MARTEDEPNCEPDVNRGSTWGVRIMPERSGRPNPYGVQWPEKRWDDATGKLVREVKTLFFPTTDARDRKASELRDLRQAGMLMESVSRAELADFRAFKAATEGTPWQNVVAGWRVHLMSKGIRPCTLGVEAAVTEYMEFQKQLVADEKISPDTLRQKKHKLALFAEQYGHLTMDRVPHHEIEAWVDDFPEVQSDETFDNWIKILRAFYNYYVKKKRVLAENPCEMISRRFDGVGEVHIISVAQTAQLFHTALTYRDAHDDAKFMPMMGRLALECFVGLRFSSGSKIEKADIRRADKGILLPKRKLKTKRRHYVDGLPAHVWPWIDLIPESCWHLTPRHYMGLKSELFHVADVPHPFNCCRHSFATYHMAALKNPGLTATILCHQSQELLWERYNGIATEAQGKAFQKLTPQTAKRMAAGFVPASSLPQPNGQSPHPA